MPDIFIARPRHRLRPAILCWCDEPPYYVAIGVPEGLDADIDLPLAVGCIDIAEAYPYEVDIYLYSHSERDSRLLAAVCGHPVGLEVNCCRGRYSGDAMIRRLTTTLPPDMSLPAASGPPDPH